MFLFNPRTIIIIFGILDFSLQNNNNYNYYYYRLCSKMGLKSISLSIRFIAGCQNKSIQQQPNTNNNFNQRPNKKRTYNSITKIITGNPYIHPRNIYGKTSIYPKQPFWHF